MEQIENLTQLEVAVDKLLVSMNEIRQDKLLAEARLEEKDKEIADLKEQLEGLENERNQIHQRVSDLIGSIDKWEKMNESQSGAKQADSPRAEEKTLF